MYITYILLPYLRTVTTIPTMYCVHNAPAFVLGCFRGTATSFAWFRTFIHAKTLDWKAICVEVSRISPDYLHQLPLGTPTGDFEYSAGGPSLRVSRSITIYQLSTSYSRYSYVCIYLWCYTHYTIYPLTYYMRYMQYNLVLKHYVAAALAQFLWYTLSRDTTFHRTLSSNAYCIFVVLYPTIASGIMPTSDTSKCSMIPAIDHCHTAT